MSSVGRCICFNIEIFAMWIEMSELHEKDGSKLEILNCFLRGCKVLTSVPVRVSYMCCTCIVH